MRYFCIYLFNIIWCTFFDVQGIAHRCRNQGALEELASPRFCNKQRSASYVQKMLPFSKGKMSLKHLVSKFEMLPTSLETHHLRRTEYNCDISLLREEVTNALKRIKSTVECSLIKEGQSDKYKDRQQIMEISESEKQKSIQMAKVPLRPLSSGKFVLWVFASYVYRLGSLIDLVFSGFQFKVVTKQILLSIGLYRKVFIDFSLLNCVQNTSGLSRRHHFFAMHKRNVIKLIANKEKHLLSL